MAANYLEQLIAEWYEHQGFFVRRNVLAGKRLKGGHECELDVVAFHPHKKLLVHIEPSMDASSWDERERRYKKKFDAGRKYIPHLFQGLELPNRLFSFSRSSSSTKLLDDEFPQGPGGPYPETG
jgi:hypothetical protein